jgi:DNA-binding winged helix-turn-helix (wHTH) protein/Flp pilus assembly protein TadD
VVIRLRQVRADGAPIDAQPKTFDLLVYLIKNRDRVVDKDELLERLWSGAIVTDSALTQIVRKARSLAGDDGDRQAVIRTIQRRGFRFVAVVRELSDASPTTDDLCDRGFAYLQRTSRRSRRFAVDLFQQALTFDPESVRAWAGHALSHIVQYPATTSTQQRRADALQAATRARELGPRSAVAWTAFGAATAINEGFATAESAFVRAIDLDATLFETYYYFGNACLEAGEYQRAADLYERAAAVRPDDYQALVFARQAYRSLRRAAEELRAAERQVAAAERALRGDPADARALSLSSGSLVVLGRVDEARDWTRRACALEPNEPYVHYNAAGVLARLGQVESALMELESGTENGRRCRPSWVEHDEDLAPLRDHPRFQTLLAKMRAEERGPQPERMLGGRD